MFPLKVFTYRQLFLFLIMISSLLSVRDIYAGVEEVYVAKVMSNDDNAIIVRKNGEAYLIEKGIGCFSFWQYEGKKVLIVSPGLFLGIGSKLLIPENDQECRIWDSKELRTWSNAPPARTLPSKPSESLDDTTVKLVQISLQSLGFDVGSVDGKFGRKTTSALKSFQKKEKLPPSGKLNPQTYLALSKRIYQKYPNNEKKLQVAITLLTLAKGRQPSSVGSSTSDCENGHWISSVSSGGEIIILEDGSVWEVVSIDTIYTSLWLPTEDIIICNDTMINTNNGEKVGVTRLR